MPCDKGLSKLPKKLRLEDEAHDFVETVAAQCEISTSECIESMLLLVECVYNNDSDEQVIFTLRELKCKHLLGLKSLRTPPSTSLCHVTIHPHALDFANYLHETYPPVIGNATEAISLCISYCRQFYRGGSGLKYLCGRLKDARNARE